MTVTRPMLWISAAFVAGMYLLSFLGATVTCTVIFCLSVACIIKALQKRKLYENLMLCLLFVCFATGVLLYGLCDDITRRELYPYLNQTVVLSGKITEDAKVGENYISMYLETDSVTTDLNETQPVSDKVFVTCFIDKNASEQIPLPKQGNIITVCAELDVPSGSMNTGGFSFSDYMKTKKIFFQGIGEPASLQITGHETHILADRIYAFRKKCGALFDATFPSAECSVLKAYVLGDSKEMSPHISDVFSASGLSHVLAVSGMHVVVLISAITYFFRVIHLPKRWQLTILLFLVPLYVIFTGMSVSAIRAGFVCIVALLAKLLYKRSEPLTALAEAAAFLCALNPLVIRSASFMLSFSATLGILIFGNNTSGKMTSFYDKLKDMPRRRKLVKTSCDTFLIGVCAQIFTIPILVYLFQSFSVTSVVATLILTPLLTPLLAGGLLFCFIGNMIPFLAAPFAGFIYLLTKWMLLVAQFFAAIPFSKIIIGRLTPFLLLVYAVLICTVYAAWNKKVFLYRTAISSVAVLSVIFLLFRTMEYPVASVSFMNVGQGDCALIQAPGNCDILIDAGGREGDASVAEETVLPYLRREGVYDIEYAVASHGHSDHINGIIGLMELTEIKNLIIPEGFGETECAKELLAKANANAINVIKLKHGDSMKFQNGLTITAILPDDKILAYLSNDNENNRSLVLKTEYGDNAFLFTGDISAETEGYAASLYKEALRADVIKVAHHGSAKANSSSFLKAVSPSYAFIPVGKNGFGQPGTSTLTRLEEENIAYYRADVHKDVTFYIDKTRIRGIQWSNH